MKSRLIWHFPHSVFYSYLPSQLALLSLEMTDLSWIPCSQPLPSDALNHTSVVSALMREIRGLTHRLIVKLEAK